MPLRLCILAVGMFAALLVSPSLWAAPTVEQRAEIAALGTLMTKAATLFTESKFKEAGEVVREVQNRLDKLAEGADQSTMALITPIHKRLAVAHAKLVTEGIKLPELKPLPDAKPAAAKAAPAKTKTATAKTAEKAATPTVSFVKEVAPILNTRCGGCHVRNARGQFSMATFDSLMKGPMKTGKVIFPGDVKGSVLIEKVQEKEMPPSGAGIPEADLATLKKWVEQGAKFDGSDPAAQLTTYIPASTPSGTAKATVQKATGKETVSFAREIAPIFVKNCTGCHGTDQPRNDFSVNTITSLLTGGMSGEPILPGKPAESLLPRKLRGTGPGGRMPQRSPALDEATIAKIEKWIEEGAKYDAPDATQPLLQVAAIAKAQSSNHEQLTKDRAELAAENWRLGMPGRPASKFESENFLVMGDVGENTLSDIAKRAQTLAPKIADIFKAPRDQPLVKGRITLFVFGDRYDYGEFGKMVEKHDLPTAWRGHYRFSIVDAYGAVLMPKTNEYDLDALIAQQLAAVYVASLANKDVPVPHWFAEGCGRVVATRMAPSSDQRVSQWDPALSSVVGSLAKPDDFLTGKLPPESADVCSFSFAKFLMSDSRRFGLLLDALRKGGDFKKVFGETFGGSPEQLAAVWVRNPPKVGRLKGK